MDEESQAARVAEAQAKTTQRFVFVWGTFNVTMVMTREELMAKLQELERARRERPGHDDSDFHLAIVTNVPAKYRSATEWPPAERQQDHERFALSLANLELAGKVPDDDEHGIFGYDAAVPEDQRKYTKVKVCMGGATRRGGGGVEEKYVLRYMGLHAVLHITAAEFAQFRILAGTQQLFKSSDTNEPHIADAIERLRDIGKKYPNKILTVAEDKTDTQMAFAAMLVLLEAGEVPADSDLVWIKYVQTKPGKENVMRKITKSE